MDRSLLQREITSIIDRLGRSGDVRKDFLRFELQYIATEDLQKLLDLSKSGATLDNKSNSTLIYVLGLSNNLNKESRVLHSVSGSGPDIDTDFSPKGREAVFSYILERYGSDNVAQICTYVPWNVNKSVVDFSRVIPLKDSSGNVITDVNGDPVYGGYQQGEEIKKSIPESFRGKKITWTDMSQDSAFSALIKKYEEIFKYVALVDTNPMLSGIHPCGVVISPEPLSNYIPLRRLQSNSDINITQWESSDLEKYANFTKFDLLVIDNLELNRRVAEAAGYDIEWLDTIDYNDQCVFDLINSGNNHGIFQIEETHVYNVIRDAPVESVNDIAAISALIRPGPKDAGLTTDYIQWKKTGKFQNRVHPLLNTALAETGGVLVYQEQVMQACSILAGIDLVLADEIRKAMGKKDQKLMDRYQEIFINGCKRVNNIDQHEAKRIWDVIAGFAEYGFNKSHALAYAFLTYQNAYLKTYYPLLFLSTLMSLRADKPDKFKKYLHHTRQSGITVRPPQINTSGMDFTPDLKNNSVLFGLNSIHGLGETVVGKILEAREEGEFYDLWDFLARVDRSKVNTRSIEILVKTGAFDTMGYDRQDLYDKLPEIFSYLSEYQSYIDNGVKYSERQLEIAQWQTEFAVWDALNKAKQVVKLKDASGKVYYNPERPKKPVEIKKKDKPERPNLELLKRLRPRVTVDMVYWEAEFCKAFISKHPLDFIKNPGAVSYNLIEDIDNAHAQQGNLLAAIVSVDEIKIKHGRNKGKRMANIVLEDYTASAEVIIFNKQWEDIVANNEIPVPGNVVYFTYKLSEISGETKRLQLLGKMKVL